MGRLTSHSVRGLWAGLHLMCLGLISLGLSGPASGRETGDYPLGPESQVQTGIAHGQLEGPFEFHSQVFPGTVRRYWIYVPASLLPGRDPNLLVFQDGQRATHPGGPLRLPVVLDNLIAHGDIEPTIGVFITPGNLSLHYPDTLGMSNPDHRAEEYDALSDDYGRMLLHEILPEVARHHSFTNDPRRRVIGGTSSGAICAFTVAWNHPEAFGNVISLIGSYTSIGYHPATATRPMQPGGDLYPGLIRKSPIRPLRIFLQDGSHDLDNAHGNWYLANLQIISSINWANANADMVKDKGPRYSLNSVLGDGDHSDQHGGSIMPDILKWIWPRQN